MGAAARLALALAVALAAATPANDGPLSAADCATDWECERTHGLPAGPAPTGSGVTP